MASINFCLSSSCSFLLSVLLVVAAPGREGAVVPAFWERAVVPVGDTAVLVLVLSIVLEVSETADVILVRLVVTVVGEEDGSPEQAEHNKSTAAMLIDSRSLIFINREPTAFQK